MQTNKLIVTRKLRMDLEDGYPSTIYIYSAAAEYSQETEKKRKNDPNWKNNSLKVSKLNHEFKLYDNPKSPDMYYEEKGAIFINGRVVIKISYLEDIWARKREDNKEPVVFIALQSYQCNTCLTKCYHKQSHTKDALHIKNVKSLKNLEDREMETVRGPKNSFLLEQIENINFNMNEVSVNDVGIVTTNKNAMTVTLDKEGESYTEFRLVNNTDNTIQLQKIVVSNAKLGDIFFTEKNGYKIGHHIVYEFQDDKDETKPKTLRANEGTNKSIQVFSANKVCSQDLDIHIFWKDKGVSKSTTKSFQFKRNYLYRNYSCEIHPKDFQKFTIKEKHDGDEVQRKKKKRSRYLTPKWYVDYELIEHHLQNKTEDLLIGRPKEILQIMTQKTNSKNYREKFVHHSLAELHNYYTNQFSAEVEVIEVTKGNTGMTGDTLTIDAKLLVTKKLGLKVGDTLLILIDKTVCKKTKISLIGTDYVSVVTDEPDIVQKGDKLQISPTVRTTPFEIMLDILESLENEELHKSVSKIFVPEDYETPTCHPPEPVEVVNTNMNPKQKTTLFQIMCMAIGTVFLMFGPPGSGKSTLGVEYVIQEYKRKKKVLVVTPTNAAAANIHRMLMENENLKTANIVKFVSSSCPVTKYCETYCRGFLNEDNSQHIPPDNFTLRESDIVVTTGHTAYRLHSLLDGVKVWHKVFDIIFYDEGAYPHEGNLLIPITRQIMSGNVNFKLVVAGDPHQIKLTSRSLLGRIGDQQDFMSRIAESAMYRNNPQLLSRLQLNYRNGQHIVNELNILAYKAEPLISTRAISGKISFSHVETSYTDITDTSKHSLPEAVMSLDIARYFHKQKMGETVISTYYGGNVGVILTEAKSRRQHGIRASTGESLQGLECNNVIISTCMRSASNTWHLDPNRLNVMLSRARDNVVIVGNLFILADSPLFRPILIQSLELGQVTAQDHVLEKIKRQIKKKMCAN